MFTSIGRILPETVHRKGMARDLRLAMTLEIFEEEAMLGAPDGVAGAFRVMHLRAGTLTVACRTAAAARHIKSREAAILEALSAAGADPIERIRTILAPWR